MADENTTQNLGQEPETVNDDTTLDELPDSADGTFSAEYVKKLRDEAAKYRVRAKEHESRLAQLEADAKQRKESELAEKEDFKTLAEQRAQELETLKAQVRNQEIQQLRMQTVQELGLPADALEFLTGTDEETIKAQAEKFKNLLPEPSEAGSQQPRQKRVAMIPGGEPASETREQKNRRLGLNGSRYTIQ